MKGLSTKVNIMFGFRRNNYSEANSGPCQKSNIKIFTKMVNSFPSSLIFSKSFILDYWQGSDYAPAVNIRDPTASMMPALLLIEMYIDKNSK